MRRNGVFLVSLLRILGLSILSAFLILLRYLLRVPQPVAKKFAGQERLFAWTQGHISYTVLGAADAAPLVMLHTPEIAGSSYEFRALLEPLAQRYRVYLPDLLGFGLSDRPTIAYSGKTYTTLCEDFLTSVVQRPATILASGLSCNYSIALAGKRPELCERLILLAPYALHRNISIDSRVTKIVQQPLLALLIYAFLTIRVVLRRVLARQQGLREVAVTQDELDYAYSVAHQFGAEHASIAFLAGQLWLDVVQEAPNVPVLLLWGATTTQSEKSIAERYANVQSVFIQNAGPRPHKEQPEKVVAQILQESPSEPAEEQIEAYCVKCKQKRIMENPTDVVTQNGRNAKTGTCPVCGTKLFRFVAAQGE